MAADSHATSDLARQRVATRHRENPLDRRRVGWQRGVAEDLQPSSHAAPRERDRGGGELLHIRRVDRRRERVEQRDLVGKELALARDDRDDVTATNLGQERQDLITDAVSPKSAIAIRRVADDFEPQRSDESFGLFAAQPQDWMAPTESHADKAVRSRTAHEVEQHGLSLVIGGVAGCDLGRQRGKTRRAGARLQVRTRRDLDAQRGERGSDRVGVTADDVGFLCGSEAQTVVDVVRGHPTAGRDCEDHQGERVRAA